MPLYQYDSLLRIFTLVPLLGPTGGGLGLGAAPSSGAAVVAAAGEAAASSDALTATSLELLLELLLLFFEDKINILLLLEPEFALVATLGVSKNPEAADARLQLAITIFFSFSLKSALERIFAETLVENKDDFLQTFSTEKDFTRSAVSSGELLEQKASKGHISHCNSNLKAAASDLEVVRMVVGNMAAGHLYSRLIPLVLLLVDGSNPIDVTDPRWELYLLIQKMDQQGDSQHILLGFTAIYRFYHYPNSTRMRLSQILILPPYQRKGYGSYLVEVLSNVAVAENVHDFTVEEPLDSFQHVRTCVDIQRLLDFEPIQHAINSAVLHLKQGKLSKQIYPPQFLPPVGTVEVVRKTLKINKKQFLQCWEILIYLGLDPVDKYIEDYTTIISNRVREDILGKDSGTTGKRVHDVPSPYNPEMSFVMFQLQNGETTSVQMDENQPSQEEQLQQFVDERIKEIKLIAQKVSPHPV